MDERHVFAGSFNFGPRPVLHNTEMGSLIDSPQLAQGMNDMLREKLATYAYAVRFDAGGKLHWRERGADGEREYDAEPNSLFWRRVSIRLLSLLPIEHLL